ncbi:MAG: hypothetical protein P1P80_06145 [ANME-2 cluster archaeon]|nr:hypothetical protein [ANME-2 cluster archaeon]
MEELLKTFTIPDNTTMEEHSIVVDGGVIIGNYSDLGFGIIADSVIAGERVNIGGNVLGSEGIRIDMWSHVTGDVRTKNEAYIGEFVNIEGKLIVGGDLDIGKNVKIGGGFEAKGWIVVRNPIPVIIYIYLYLTEMLRLGKGEEVEKALSEIFSEEDEDIYEDRLLIIPNGSKVDMETIRVPDRADIGRGCRLMGNIRATSLVMGNNNTLFGSIKTIGDIVIGNGNTIHGNLVTKGKVHVGKGTHILGEINGDEVTVHEEAKVDGPMRAPSGVIITGDEIRVVPKKGGILDMIPEPAAAKSQKGTATEEVFAIPKTRMNTAIRLSEIEKTQGARLKVTTKKRTVKTKAAEGKIESKKTAATTKKSTNTKKSAANMAASNPETANTKIGVIKATAKKVAAKKPTTKKDVVSSKISTKNTTTKKTAASGKTSTKKITTKKKGTKKKGAK